MFTSLAVVACVMMLFESGNTEPHQTSGLVGGSGGSCERLIHHDGLDVNKRLFNCQLNWETCRMNSLLLHLCHSIIIVPNYN